jgi:hypothetical protein
MLSSVVLYRDSQPDFDKLLAKGWKHPLGIRDEPLERSLVKEFNGLCFQIVRHEFQHTATKYQTYTEVYVHSASDDEDKPTLKGDGTPFSVFDLCSAIYWLEEELEQEKSLYRPAPDEEPF